MASKDYVREAREGGMYGVDEPLIPGVGPDTPTETNEQGGKQSKVPYRCDLLPPLALLDVAAVLCKGLEKYPVDNWRKIDVRDHVNHAMTHLLAYLAGDKQDRHLAHAACRVLFALELER